MLNCFKDFKRKRCIHISFHILDFVQQKTRFTMEQPYMLIPYCPYHSCWCSGDWRSQGISRHGIDQYWRNIPSLASEELKRSTSDICSASVELKLENIWQQIKDTYMKHMWGKYCRETLIKATDAPLTQGPVTAVMYAIPMFCWTML